MEIVFNNVSYNKNLRDINIKFNSGLIYGIVGKNSCYIKDILLGNITNYKGKVNKEDCIVSYINSSDDMFCCNSVKDEIKFSCKMRKYNKRNIKQEAIELFYKLGINEELYYRKIHGLSRSEKYLIRIVIGLITNPSTIIFENIFNNLDLKYRNKLSKLIEVLERDNIIIIIDDNPDIMYGLAKYMYIIKDSKIVVSGSVDKVYQNEEDLIKYKVMIPSLCNIVFKAMDKKIKLPFRKDVRDTMKDIYRNV